MKSIQQLPIAGFVSAIIAAAWLIPEAMLLAQNPFGDFGAPQPTEPNAAKVPPPAGTAPQNGAAETAGAAAKQTKAAAQAIDPTQYALPIRAVLESQPQTPAQLVRAARALIDLGEPALAKPYLVKLQAASLEDSALVELVRQLGSGPFIKIAGEPALQPEGREFGDRAIAAASRQARDPKRLAHLVDQLSDSAAETQRQAIAELLNAHQYAVGPLVAAMNDPAKESLRRRIKTALLALGADAIDPLIATLDGPDSPGKVVALEVLGRLAADKATPSLVSLYASGSTSPDVRAAAEQALLDTYGKTPTRGEAIKYLQQKTREAFLQTQPTTTGADDKSDLWIWDSVKGQPVIVSMSLNQSQSHVAAALGRRLFELQPRDPQLMRLYLVTLLEAEAYRVGRDNPVPRGAGSTFAIAAQMGGEAVEDAMSYALASGHAAAATVAAEILGEIADVGLLVRGADPVPLAAALSHDDRRLRFAAAQAIVRLKPKTPFAGLSQLKEALVYFAGSSGERRAFVGFPALDTAHELAGMLNALGLAGEAATNGRDLLLKGTKSGDNELFLISSRIDRAPLYQVLQDLRQHPHTAQTPIVILAEDDELGELRELVRDDPLTTAALRPRELEGMKYAVEQSQRRAGDRILAPAVRERQAKEALRSIEQLSVEAPKVFDFRDYEQQLSILRYRPTLSAMAAKVLAQFGTHTSQQALLEIANRNSQPIVTRQAAALAFGQSVRRFGVRLTKPEILRQYDRYNQSELEDTASQDLLAAVLDAIELPAKTASARSE